MNPKQINSLRASVLNPASSISALFVHSVDTSGAYVSPGAGSTQVSIREVLTAGGVSVMDSTNNSVGVTIRAGSASGIEYTDGDIDLTITGKALLFDNSSGGTLRPVTSARGLPVNLIAGQSTTVNVSSVAGRVEVGDYSTAVAPAAGSSGLIVRLSAPLMDSTNNAIRVFQVASSGGASSTEVTIRQSTYTDLGTLSRLADRDVSTNVANVTNTTPASTAYALAVREVVPQSTTVNVSSVAGRVLVDQNSTTWSISTVAGRVLVDQNSTVWVAQVKLQDSSGVTASITNATPSTAAQGLVVRPVVNGINSTTVLVTSTNSTAFYSLIPLVASARQKVFAYGIFSTHTVPSTFVFFSSTSAERWAVGFGSGSSGITGANLAVSPPAWLFNSDVGGSIQCRVEGGSSAASTVIVRVSLAWFSEA